MSKTTHLTDRSLIEIGGPDAEAFLNGLVTCETLGLEAGDLRFGALLQPQGKILFDFFVLATATGFLIDVQNDMQDELIKRLMYYRLRKQVDIAAHNANLNVFAALDEPASPADGFKARDPRQPSMGWRLYTDKIDQADTFDYKELRLAVGMPQGGVDFDYGDTFPHEALMDQFGGVDFQKGCFVGQEVVSRMQHRGTSRKRVIKVAASTDLPLDENDILADGKPLGRLGTRLGNRGLALLRLDRVAEAQADGLAITVGTVAFTAQLQEWVNFDWPSKA